MNPHEYSRKFLLQFSILSIFVTLQSFPKFYRQSQSLEIAKWIFPASIFEPSGALQYWSIFALIIFAFLGCLWMRNLVGALVLPLVWALALSFEFSFGKIDNSKLGFFFVSLGFLLFYRRKLIGERSPLLVAGATAGYLAAGLWKARALLTSADLWPMSQMALPSHLAYAVAEGSLNETGPLQFLVSHGNIAGLLWLSVILIQIVATPLSVVWAPQWPKILLIFIGFHLCTKLLMGILFREQIFLLIWLMFFLESQRRPAKSNQSD